MLRHWIHQYCVKINITAISVLWTLVMMMTIRVLVKTMMKFLNCVVNEQKVMRNFSTKIAFFDRELLARAQMLGV